MILNYHFLAGRNNGQIPERLVKIQKKIEKERIKINVKVILPVVGVNKRSMKSS